MAFTNESNAKQEIFNNITKKLDKKSNKIFDSVTSFGRAIQQEYKKDYQQTAETEKAFQDIIKALNKLKSLKNKRNNLLNSNMLSNDTKKYIEVYNKLIKDIQEVNVQLQNSKNVLNLQVHTIQHDIKEVTTNALEKECNYLIETLNNIQEKNEIINSNLSIKVQNFYKDLSKMCNFDISENSFAINQLQTLIMPSVQNNKPNANASMAIGQELQTVYQCLIAPINNLSSSLYKTKESTNNIAQQYSNVIANMQTSPNETIEEEDTDMFQDAKDLCKNLMLEGQDKIRNAMSSKDKLNLHSIINSAKEIYNGKSIDKKELLNLVQQFETYSANSFSSNNNVKSFEEVMNNNVSDENWATLYYSEWKKKLPSSALHRNLNLSSDLLNMFSNGASEENDLLTRQLVVYEKQIEMFNNQADKLIDNEYLNGEKLRLDENKTNRFKNKYINNVRKQELTADAESLLQVTDSQLNLATKIGGSKLGWLKYSMLDEDNKQKIDEIQKGVEETKATINSMLSTLRRYKEEVGEVDDTVIAKLEIRYKEMDNASKMLDGLKDNEFKKLAEMLSELNAMKNQIVGKVKKALSVIGVSAILNPMQMLNDIGAMMKENGVLRYNTSMIDSSSGVGISTSNNFYITGDLVDKYWGGTYEQIGKSEVVNTYKAVSNMGASYDKSKGQRRQDINFMTDQVMLNKTVLGISDETSTEYLKNFYKDMRMSAEASVARMRNLQSIANMSSIPVETLMQTVSSLAKSLRSLGMDTVMVENALVSVQQMGMRIEDASALVQQTASATSKFANDMGKNLVWSALSGEDSKNPFETYNKGLLTHNSDGSINEEYIDTITDRMFAESNYFGERGGLDNAVGMSEMALKLKEQGFNAQQTSQLVQLAKEGRIDEFKEKVKGFEEFSSPTAPAEKTEELNQALHTASEQLSVFQQYKAIYKRFINKVANYIEKTMGPLINGLLTHLHGILITFEGFLIDEIKKLSVLFQNGSLGKEITDSFADSPLATLTTGIFAYNLTKNAIKASKENPNMGVPFLKNALKAGITADTVWNTAKDNEGKPQLAVLKELFESGQAKTQILDPENAEQRKRNLIVASIGAIGTVALNLVSVGKNIVKRIKNYRRKLIVKEMLRQREEHRNKIFQQNRRLYTKRLLNWRKHHNKLKQLVKAGKLPPHVLEEHKRVKPKMVNDLKGNKQEFKNDKIANELRKRFYSQAKANVHIDKPIAGHHAIDYKRNFKRNKGNKFKNANKASKYSLGNLASNLFGAMTVTANEASENDMSTGRMVADILVGTAVMSTTDLLGDSVASKLKIKNNIYIDLASSAGGMYLSDMAIEATNDFFDNHNMFMNEKESSNIPSQSNQNTYSPSSALPAQYQNQYSPQTNQEDKITFKPTESFLASTGLYNNAVKDYMLDNRATGSKQIIQSRKDLSTLMEKSYANHGMSVENASEEEKKLWIAKMQEYTEIYGDIDKACFMASEMVKQVKNAMAGLHNGAGGKVELSQEEKLKIQAKVKEIMGDNSKRGDFYLKNASNMGDDKLIYEVLGHHFKKDGNVRDKIIEIANKPQSQWTAEEAKLMKSLGGVNQIRKSIGVTNSQVYISEEQLNSLLDNLAKNRYNEDSSKLTDILTKEKLAELQSIIGVGTAQGNNAGNRAFNQLKSLGATDVMAAGIIGNIVQESTFNTRNINDTKTHAGLFQWDIGGRWETAQQWIKSQGGDVYSQDWQIAYAVKEAKERGDWARMQQATSAEEAAKIWDDWFERSGGSELARRQAQAKIALATQGAGVDGADTKVGGAMTPPPNIGGGTYTIQGDANATQIDSRIKTDAIDPNRGSDAIDKLLDSTKAMVNFAYQTYVKMFGDDGTFSLNSGYRSESDTGHGRGEKADIYGQALDDTENRHKYLAVLRQAGIGANDEFEWHWQGWRKQGLTDDRHLDLDVTGYQWQPDAKGEMGGFKGGGTFNVGGGITNFQMPNFEPPKQKTIKETREEQEAKYKNTLSKIFGDGGKTLQGRIVGGNKIDTSQKFQSVEDIKEGYRRQGFKEISVEHEDLLKRSKEDIEKSVAETKKSKELDILRKKNPKFREILQKVEEIVNNYMEDANIACNCSYK